MKEVRPTSGRVLLALFSILDSMRSGSFGLEGVAFLDLFSGTGRVGLDALSRGASSVVMVETLKDRSRRIEEAIPPEYKGNATILSLEFRRALAWLVKREQIFDIVFADPPYNEGWGASLLQEKNLRKVVARDGIMVVEHASREALVVSEHWIVKEARPYGETTLTFLSPGTAEMEGTP